MRPLSKAGRAALRRAMVGAFTEAAADPQIRDFGDACCYVIGRLEGIADCELRTVELFDELRRIGTAPPPRVDGGRQLLLLLCSRLPDKLEQAELLLAGGCECDQGRPWDCPEHVDQHDREFCDCGSCENWRRAEATHRGHT